MGSIPLDQEPEEDVTHVPSCPPWTARHVRLLDGKTVLLRPIRPEDGPRLVEFHAALSERSVYLRFFSFHPVLSEREVERFTHVDYVDRYALVVEHDGRLLGVGRFERVGDTTDAEVAFVVSDAAQGTGIATLIADELARAAWARGITAFVAETLPENSGMLEVFFGLGFPVTSSFGAGVVRVRFPIEPTPAYLEGLARREAGRTGEGAPHARNAEPRAKAGDRHGAPPC